MTTGDVPGMLKVHVARKARRNTAVLHRTHVYRAPVYRTHVYRTHVYRTHVC
jgi:hypothetical protein